MRMDLLFLFRRIVVPHFRGGHLSDFPPAAARVKQVVSLKLMFNRSERLAEIAGTGFTILELSFPLPVVLARELTEIG